MLTPRKAVSNSILDELVEQIASVLSIYGPGRRLHERWGLASVRIAELPPPEVSFRHLGICFEHSLEERHLVPTIRPQEVGIEREWRIERREVAILWIC